MANMRPPAVPEPPPRVLTDDLRRLLKACEGKGFEDRRDTALVRLLLDTGARRAELVGLGVGDVDFDHNVALVLGKGRRPRPCRSAARRPRRWTATCVPVRVTGTPPCPTCGSAQGAH